MPVFQFDPLATTFSLQNARLLGQAAAVAYREPADCERWARANGLDEDFSFFSTAGITRLCDTQGFIAQNKQIVLIAFRGTEPRQRIDWLSDIQLLHETWGHPVGKVHKGFYEALRAVWEHPHEGRDILPGRLLQRGERTVWITGHSLGGALAELCAAQAFFVTHVPVQGVYTFGQPRVGDETFARTVHDAIGLRVFRFVNDKDIVPRVPFFGLGYRHYGCEVFFDHSKTQVNRDACIENLAGALQLAKLAFGFDAIEEAAKMLADAIRKAAFHGNPAAILHQMVREREEVALRAAKALLALGIEKIDDHSMTEHYLDRLGTKLVLEQAV